MNSISVTNLCLLLLGICCFKTVSGQIGGWSNWRCEKIGDICYRTRTCNSSIDFNCPTKSEVNQTACPCVADTSSVSGHDGVWSDWRCEQTKDNCFKIRTCNSTIDSNCPKKNEIHFIKCPCDAEWTQWGNWACTQNQDVCLNIRQRSCIRGFKETSCSELHGKDFETVQCDSDKPCKNFSSVSSHDGGWSNWRCEEDENNVCYKIRTCNSTIDFNCPDKSEVNITTCPCVAEWSPWGKWTCTQSGNICLNIRQRSCISGFTDQTCSTLPGKDFETVPCANNMTCTITNTTPTTQVVSTSTKAITTTTQKPFNLPDATATTAAVSLGSKYSPTKDATTNIFMVSTISSQKPASTPAATSMSMPSSTQLEPTPSTPTTASLTMTLHQTTISTSTSSSNPLSASKPTVESSSAYIYWFEWTGWECKNVTICLMSRTRNCSTYNPADCEEKLEGKHFQVEPCKKEICPVTWLEWSSWTCRIEKGGSCNKTRSRKCSTGSDAQCGFDSLQREQCDDVTCPELTKLGKLGYCKDLDNSKCSDADSCENQSILLMCLADAHVASKICPKACGCCHVDPEWSRWSNWTCERTNTMCRMKQSRTCSTGNTTECEGISVREAVCDERLCPEPTWQSWSGWECQLRQNNTCKMSRYRKCSDEDFCNGENHEEDECSSEVCPDFVDFKVDCSLHNTKSDACVDGAGCHYFKNTPKTLCVDDAAACPVTCGCCIPSISSVDKTTSAPSIVNGSNGTGSENTTNITIGVTTQNPSGSGGNGSNGTDSGNTTNNTICLTTQNPSGSGGNSSNGTDSGVITNNPIGVTTQNPSGSGGNCSNGTGSGVITNKPIDVTTQNPSASVGNGSNGTDSGLTTNNPIGVITKNPSGSGENSSNETGSGVTSNTPIGVTIQNPSGSGGNGSNGTGSGVITNNTIGLTTQNPSGSGGNGSNGTGSGISTNNPIGVITHNPSGSGGNGSNGTGSRFTTNNPIGVTTQNQSGSGGNGSNGTNSGVITNNPIGEATQNPSGSGGNGSNGTGSGVTTNSPIGVITQNPSGSSGNGSNGTGSGITTKNPIGMTTQNQSGSGGNGLNGTGSEVTTNNSIGISTQNPFGSGGNSSNGTGSTVTTNNPIGVITQNTSGSSGNGSNGTDSGVTTNKPVGVTTQNPSGSGENGSNGTGSGVTTNNPIVVTTQNPSGSGGNGSNGTGSGVTTNNPIGITTQNPSGSGGNGSNGTGSGVTTKDPIAFITQNPSGSGGNVSNGGTTNNHIDTTILNASGPGGPISVTTKNPSGSGGNGSNETGSGASTNSQTVAPTPSPTKTTTTTQKQPHTPTPAAVTCNVCAGPEFLCEKLFAPQTCSPPNNYCINKLTNHIDGTRMVTRHCGNFDTCYREWFLGSSDSDKCRNFEDNNIITLDFDCTYCCTSDNCNKPIKPLDKDLYKDL
ncbi:mucin-2-like [Ruditapes philippinarum]|uniref:mucin-2-like n=1 Tax=Ruditapes philippinarum TaxID=129788 RepID=UPI00295BC013|nr:mucin-2-like [Ruditapes philippinarum]